MKIRKKIIITKGIGIHCKNKKDAIELLTLADSLGYKWCNGRSFLYDKYMQYHNENTYYDICAGEYCDVNYIWDKDIVITFNDFMKNYQLIKK